MFKMSTVGFGRGLLFWLTLYISHKCYTLEKTQTYMLQLLAEISNSVVNAFLQGLFLSSFTACDNIPELLTNLVDWGRLNWGHSSLANQVMAIWLVNSKLEMVKTIVTPREVDAILLNIRINRQKLVSMCGYKLPTNWQDVTEIQLDYVKMLQKVLGRLFFTHTVGCHIVSL